jgi:hypothetical protein
LEQVDKEVLEQVRAKLLCQLVPIAFNFKGAMKISILAFKFLSRFKLKSYSACAII